jgi:hypothetical protein
MTDYTDPTGRDPRFPNRPTHPDFAELSDAVQANDKEADAGRLLDRIADFVDLESLEYIVLQRAMRMAEIKGGDVAQIAGAIMDGFALGAAYERGRMTPIDRNTAG